MPLFNYGNYLQNAEAWYGVGDAAVGQEMPLGAFDNVEVVNLGEQEMKFKDPKSAKKDRSVSPPSDEYQALTEQIVECQESCRRESEEVARALEEISRLVEVVRDVGSQVRHRITILQKVANQLEMWMQKLPQPSSPDSEKGPPASHSAPVGAAQPAAIGVPQAALMPWLVDQG